jgi:hypothetical protein
MKSDTQKKKKKILENWRPERITPYSSQRFERNKELQPEHSQYTRKHKHINTERERERENENEKWE